MAEITKVLSARHLYTLQEGEDFRFYQDMIIVVHPDRPPKIVHADGTTEELKP